MRAANGRDEPSDQSQEIGSPGHAGLGEDVIAMCSCGRLGNAESGCGFHQARAGNQQLQEANLCGGKAEDARHWPTSAGEAVLAGVTNTAAAVSAFDRRAG